MTRASKPDPIASATLAQLYLEQGHFDRARNMLELVLARDPRNGIALKWNERLEIIAPPYLDVMPRKNGFTIRWSGLRHQGTHVVVALVSTAGKASSPRKRVTSRRCNEPSGEQLIAFTDVELAPTEDAAWACACLGIVDPTQGFLVLASTAEVALVVADRA